MGATSPSASGLELTMAVPGLSSSSGSEGFVCTTTNNNINSSSNGHGHGHGNMMRDLDMNQPASGGEEEDFLMGSVEEDEEERGAGGPHRPKKLRLSKEQSRLLEESFRLNHTLSPKQKEALAIKLKLRPRQVEVWFQNRRARTKLKHTEMECEYLKRCFGSLTEENRRLQREVEELRAMRVAPPTVLSPAHAAAAPGVRSFHVPSLRAHHRCHQPADHPPDSLAVSPTPSLPGVLGITIS